MISIEKFINFKQMLRVLRANLFADSTSGDWQS